MKGVPGLGQPHKGGSIRQDIRGEVFWGVDRVPMLDNGLERGW
ncbi:hypothetical protein LJR039_000786 [Pseudorhodoferax sp. LjRoot39]